MLFESYLSCEVFFLPTLTVTDDHRYSLFVITKLSFLMIIYNFMQVNKKLSLIIILNHAEIQCSKISFVRMLNCNFRLLILLCVFQFYAAIYRQYSKIMAVPSTEYRHVMNSTKCCN